MAGVSDASSRVVISVLLRGVIDRINERCQNKSEIFFLHKAIDGTFRHEVGKYMYALISYTALRWVHQVTALSNKESRVYPLIIAYLQLQRVSKITLVLVLSVIPRKFHFMFVIF